MKVPGLIVIALLVASAAQAQMVSGQVTDASRVSVPGVSVTATSGNPGEPARTAITDAAGRYRLVNLRADVYTLTFALPGVAPFNTRALDLTRVRSATVDAVLPDPRRSGTLRGQFAPPRRSDRTCLHGEGEAPAEAGRRQAALETMRLIDYVLSTPPLPRDRSWEALSRSSVVAELRSTIGPAGDLARRIQWGSPEPLPGWGLAYVVSGAAVRYAMTDLTDRCAFTYSSADPDVIPRGRARIVPLSE
jgi:hypothetical protein